MKPHTLLKIFGAIGITAVLTSSLEAAPFGSAFTYQGRLNFNGAPAADGLYDFNFTLHDAATLGAPVGAAVMVSAVPVSNGVFTAQLDFGAPAFTSGEARWLQLQVNTNGTTPLAALNPRQRLAPTPQAIYAGSAATASAVAPGAVTGSGLAPASVSSGTIADGSIGAADLSPGLLNGTFWKLTGNTGPGNFLGSLDNQPVEIRANNVSTLRLVPDAASPSLIGGHPANRIGPGASGAFIGGGGAADGSNAVLGAFATVVGGRKNAALGMGAFVGGGSGHVVEGPYSSIVGGFGNRIDSSDFAFIGGGESNYAVWPHTVIGGGDSNRAHGFYAVIGGGRRNFTGEQGATVGGGQQNRALGHHSTIGGGDFNITDEFGSVVGGGRLNQATVRFATVGGGDNNEAHGTNSTIAGGSSNQATNDFATVGGGRANVAGGAAIGLLSTLSDLATHSTVAGGESNRARRTYATVSGGRANTVTTKYSAIGGGLGNTIHGIETAQGGTNCCEGAHSVIGGGRGNSILGFWNFNSVVAGGESNTVISPGNGATLGNVASAIGGGSQNRVVAQYATVPGGARNLASGDYSFAAGRRAKAIHDGSFVWADDTDADFVSTTNKQFAVRANHGVMIQSSATALDLRGGGALRVEGAGVNSSTPIFTHRATAASITGPETRIDHPHCNGKPNAILILTYNFNPAGATGVRNDRPFGLYYTGSRWAIYNLDNTAMPVGASYNVLVANP